MKFWRRNWYYIGGILLCAERYGFVGAGRNWYYIGGILFVGLAFGIMGH